MAVAASHKEVGPPPQTDLLPSSGPNASASRDGLACMSGRLGLWRGRGALAPIARVGRAAAAVPHILVEFGAVPGHAQALEKHPKFLGFLLEALQSLLTVFIEGAIAGRPQTALTAPASVPALQPLLKAVALALPALGCAFLPARQVRVSSTSHSSTP